MAGRVIVLPKKELDIVGVDGKPTGRKINVFVNLVTFLTENVPQESDADAYLAHAIREKLDSLRDGQVVLEEAEIAFLRDALTTLRERQVIVGSNWYFVVDGLRSAKEV